MILDDLVLFDVDGTLVDSASLWCEATRGAIAEVYAERGVALPVPDDASLRAVIGTPARLSLPTLLPKERHDLVPEIAERVRLRASEAMRGKDPPLYAGARECLAELKRRGCGIAIATNAGSRYLDAVLDRLGLRSLVSVACCLDTPGVTNKVDMVARALEEVGTRRAVMIGDRAQDREAAHGNGIPFVAFLPGYGSEAEWDGAEARVRSFEEFLAVLEERGEKIGSLAEDLFQRASAKAAALVVGVTGPLGAGKTLFADDLARCLRARGANVETVRLDDFGRPLPGPAEVRSWGDHLAAGFDLGGFLGAVGFASKRARLERRGEVGVAIVEGIFLLDERVRGAIDFAIHLDAREEVLLRRVGTRPDPGVARLVRDVYLPAHAAFAQSHPPGRLADLVLDNSNPLRPVRVGE